VPVNERLFHLPPSQELFLRLKFALRKKHYKTHAADGEMEHMWGCGCPQRRNKSCPTLYNKNSL